MPLSPVRIVAGLCALVLWMPSGASAQEPAEELAPPHLSHIDGVASLEREGRAAAAERGLILAAGDRLRTRAGRTEILFGDGSALHIDRYSTLDLLDDGLLRLIEGRVFLHVAAPPEGFDGLEFRVDTPAASIRTVMAGEYRIATADDAGPVTELAVARGFAEVVTAQGAAAVRAGELIRTRAGEQPGFAAIYNAAAWDDFDRWSYAQRRTPLHTETAAYLPPELTPYAATLARHGTWAHDATHGVVWYPQVVSTWRPFYHGRWTVLSPYGWTWVGVDPWAWPTHYYGHWGLSTAGAWFWVPGRRWSAARVHWAIGVGHVAWFPLGVASVHWIGWTVVPRHVFQVNVFVPRHAVGLRTLRPELRRAFVVQRPSTPGGIAVPRASVVARRAPLRTEAPRRVAVPRDAARTFTSSTRAVRPEPRATRPLTAGTGTDTASGGWSAPRRQEAGEPQRPGVSRAVPRTSAAPPANPSSTPSRIERPARIAPATPRRQQAPAQSSGSALSQPRASPRSSETSRIGGPPERPTDPIAGAAPRHLSSTSTTMASPGPTAGPSTRSRGVTRSGGAAVEGRPTRTPQRTATPREGGSPRRGPRSGSD